MLPTTILIDDAPRCVVRPTDSKDLNRFIRNGKAFQGCKADQGPDSHGHPPLAQLDRALAF